MEEDGVDSLHLLSDCEKGLPPPGSESVDDVAMQSGSDRLSEGSEIPLAGSSISDFCDECVEFSPASDSDLGSQGDIEFEDASQRTQDEVIPDARPYPGVDMQPWFNKRKPLGEQGQGLLANAGAVDSSKRIAPGVTGRQYGYIGNTRKQYYILYVFAYVFQYIWQLLPSHIMEAAFGPLHDSGPAAFGCWPTAWNPLCGMHPCSYCILYHIAFMLLPELFV